MLWRRSVQCGSNYSWPSRPDIFLPVCPALLIRSTSSSTTQVTVCMPAILKRFRRAQPPRRISRSTIDRCWTTTTRRIFGSSTTLGTGKSLTNQGFNRVLHASGTQVTGQGHKYLYTCAPSNGDHGEEFTVVPVPVTVTDPANPPGRFAFTGYFNLVSVRTTEMAKFGSDLTPNGNARVHQELPGSNLYFY